MIVWRGKGILIVFIVFLAFLVSTPLAAGIVNAFGMPATRAAGIGIPVALSFATVGNFFFARYLDDPARQRTLIDPKTGHAVLFRDRSHLMFIPVRVWTYILGGFAVLALIAAIFAPAVPARPPTRAGALPASHLDAGVGRARRPA